MSTSAPPSLRQSDLVRYTVAVGVVAVAVLMTDGIRAINPRIPNLALLYCAAFFSAWFGGVGPGLVTSLLSAAVVICRLMPSPYPRGTFQEELPRVVIFTFAAIFVSWISGRQRRAEELLQQARDGLEEKVRDRTAELSRANASLLAESAERKSAEEAMHTMRTELAHVSRVTMMGELTASIAHEVNQPLAAIMNYANASRRLLAANPAERAQVDEALVRIVADAHRASDVIARIRALSRKQSTERTSAVVKDLVDDVVAIANYEMNARGVTVVVNIAAELPRLQVDRVQIQQVLLNLMINGAEAMESTPPSERVITIGIRLSPSVGEPALILYVQDRGPGVSAADAGRLFAPFYSTKAQGLGLGLAISRSIIEAHGGSLSLAAHAGRGATFEIFLPVNAGVDQ